MKKEVIAGCVGFAFIYLLFLILVLCVGILSRLDPLLYGLPYDQHGLQIKKQLYTGGRHALGMGLEFIKFPRTQRLLAFSATIKKSLDAQKAAAAALVEGEGGEVHPWGDSTKGFGTIVARTKEGLVIYMDILISYKLTTTNDEAQKAEQLYNIYKNFEYRWDDMLAYLTRAEVKDAASRYEAFAFFEKRSEIGNYIFEQLQGTCQNYHITLNSLNILNLAFPTQFESAVENTEIVVQKTQTAQYQKQAAQISADTRILVANIQKQMNIEQETALGKADLIQQTSRAQAIVTKLDTQRTALLNVKKTLKLEDALGDSGANKLLAFMWVYSLKYNNAKVLRLATGLPKDLKNS